MSSAPPRPRANWTARLAWGLLLVAVGAGLAVWGLARWQAGARFLGVAAPPPAVRAAPPVRLVQPPAALAAPDNAVQAARIAQLEARLGSVEHATERAEGTAGRANALLVAFAARRAIERGVALGYLEPLLAERFGGAHERAVATVVTAGRTPQTLDALITDYERLGPVLRGPAADEGWWIGVQRELGTLVSVHRVDKPSPLPQARYDRALAALRAGKVAGALAETMRMPGASRPEAAEWIARARRQVLTTGALDEIESAALLGGGAEANALPAR